MPYEQVEKILGHARQFHHKLAEFYQKLDETSGKEDEIMAMVLSYLKDHELKLEQRLSDFDRTAGKNAMETWVQFPPVDHIDELLQQFDPERRMNLGDLLDLTLKFDSALIDFYQKAAECAPTERIAEIFENLHREGKSERRRLVSGVFEY